MEKKTLILLAAAAGIGLLLFSGNNNSLGDLDTAKTAKGRKKQRAAVFAKMDEDGVTWPKTKSGVRKKKRKR